MRDASLRWSPQADHHEATLLKLVVDVWSPAPLGTAGHTLQRQAAVQQDLDVRHTHKDTLEVCEQLAPIASNHDGHPLHRLAWTSENFPTRRPGSLRLLQSA